MDDVASIPPARLRAMPSWLINHAAITANRLTDRALAGTGSRRYHFAMLAALDEYGPSSQAALGRCTAIDRSDVAAAVNLIVERGFARRGPDPADGRRNIVTITAAGREHLEELAVLLDQAQGELLRTLSPDESTAVTGLLARVVDDH
nr:MarR family transcriptional regulator [Streptomyces sp. NBC_00899]